MIGPCEIIEREAVPTVFTRTRTPLRGLGGALRNAFETIMQYLGGRGQVSAGPPYAAYYNTDMNDLDVEIGIPVAGMLPDDGDIRPGSIPGGRFASCLYTGPYSRIGAAYEELSRWMQEQGHVPAGVAYEIYVNDPALTAPKDLQTQVLLPLRSMTS